MNQNKQAPRRRMTRREWRIRRCLRLARNWAVFLAACGAAVALMTSGILWLLPKAHALIAGPEDFVARNYDGTEYQLNLADARLVLVNGNLPLDAEPAPALAVADDATGQQLEAEAAEQYRAMAAAAAADGITLELVTGYQDVSAREAAFVPGSRCIWKRGSPKRRPRAYAASVCPPANASEQATGYAADILSPDCTEKTTRFADTRAYEWLSAPVAAQMALGAAQAAGAEIGISVTGVAGPTGGDALRPVGTVYLGAARGETVYVKKLSVSRPDRALVRARAAQAALELALRLAQGKVPAGTEPLARDAQYSPDGPAGNVGADVVVTVKDEGSLVGRGFFRVGAHAVGKIEQAVEVRQFFLFQQPVYIGEHRPEVGTAEAPELQPGDQLMQLVQTGQPLHALHLGIALDEIDLYPFGEGTALPQNVAGALQKALNDIALNTAGGVDGNHKICRITYFIIPPIILIFRNFYHWNITFRTKL